MGHAPPQEDKNDHLGKSATLVQKAGIVVRAGGAHNIECRSAFFDCSLSIKAAYEGFVCNCYLSCILACLCRLDLNDFGALR